ncbi:MAG: hypothetical protein DRP73_03590, partial [Candidatus Omnitrophota bacterium]
MVGRCQIVIGILSLTISSAALNAQDGPFMHLYFGVENSEDLSSWTDPDLIAQLEKMEFGDRQFQDLYRKFRQLLNSQEEAREKLRKVVALGKRVHNLLLVLSDEKINRYGYLLGMMRDILHMESQRLAELINQDAQAVYLHTV